MTEEEGRMGRGDLLSEEGEGLEAWGMPVADLGGMVVVKVRDGEREVGDGGGGL